MGKETQNTQTEILFGETLETDLFGNEVDLEEEAVEISEQKAEEQTVKGTKAKEEVQETIELPEVEEIVFLESEESEEKVVKGEKKQDSKESDDDTDYEGIYSTFVATGEWEEVEIEGEKTIDKETFLEIAKKQKELRLSKAKEEVLAVLTKDEKEMVEFKNNGGDLDTFVKTYNLKQQAENLDISTDRGQKYAVYAYYKNIVKWKDDRIQKHLSQLEKDLELEDEAKMAKEEIETITAREHESLKERNRLAAEKRKEDEDNFVETVKTTLKNGGFDTKTTNMIVRDFTDRDERGVTVIDRKYLELRNKPEELAELWSFLMDKEKFIEKISRKKVNESELESFKRIQINKKKKKNSSEEQHKEEGVLVFD